MRTNLPPVTVLSKTRRTKKSDLGTVTGSQGSPCLEGDVRRRFRDLMACWNGLWHNGPRRRMNPDDIIKAAPAIAKVAGPLAAAVPFTAIVKRMLGPAADELAEMWRDQVRLYRYERQLKCVEKAERMAQEAGFTPKAVPIKLLFPLLEGASLEEDEDVHTMWAALLANAASPTGGIRPGFIATLKQMSKDEAAILNCLFEEADKPRSGNKMFPLATGHNFLALT